MFIFQINIKFIITIYIEKVSWRKGFYRVILAFDWFPFFPFFF